MALNSAFMKAFSANVLRELEKRGVFLPLVNRNYEGEIRNGGDSVSIPSIGAISVENYTRGSDMTFQEIADASQTLLIDQEKYVAFEIDDVDKLQAGAAGLAYVREASAEAVYALADDMDSSIAGLYAQAGATVTDTNVTSADIISNVGLLYKQAIEYNWPTEMEWPLVVGPATYFYMQMGKILTDTNNSELLARGAVGKLGGFTIYVSNNVNNDSGTFPNVTEYNMAFLPSAITLAQQITKMEMVRFDKSFSDGVKMLNVYGRKVVQPRRLLGLTLEFATETSI